MSDIAIRAENLSKQYAIGARAVNLTLRETIVSTLRAPLKWFNTRSNSNGNKFWALDDVSFEIKHGDAVGIIGRNGAGKSTLLKVISRITKPTRGRVELYGRVGSLLEVGTGFHSELSGRENIYLNGAVLGMKRREIDRKFDEIVDFAEIEKFLDTPVKHYSSGMYMRLAFAVAAHLEPEILIIDEVLAVGDAEFQKKCLGKMNEITGKGRTVLFVSHNEDAIARLCQRAILLEAGRLVKDGSTEEVFSQYFSSLARINIELILDPAQMTPDGEYAWKIDLSDFELPGDSLDNFFHSRAILLEDGKKLGPPHTLHNIIRQDGKGAYSHWGAQLYFSSSDNTDPRSNGRTYVVKNNQLFRE